MPKIAAISIYVHDIDAAVEFYTTRLGFSVQGRPNPFMVELNHERQALVLCKAEKRTQGEYPAGTGTVVGIITENVFAAAKAFEANGVSMAIRAPEKFPGGYYIAVNDPSGNVIELLQFT
jgi:lactoylglutathione lyase